MLAGRLQSVQHPLLRLTVLGRCRPFTARKGRNVSIGRHSGMACSPRPRGSSFGPCCARPNLLRANLCRTNRQGEAQCGERAGQGRTAQDSRAKRDGVAWRGRFARIAPEGCRAGSPGMNPVHRDCERSKPSVVTGPRHSNRKRAFSRPLPCRGDDMAFARWRSGPFEGPAVESHRLCRWIVS
jgi:hypothetical protein